MLCFPCQRDSRSFRFPTRSGSTISSTRPSPCWPISTTGVIDPILAELMQQGLITPDLIPVSTNEKFFSLPDEVFHLNLGCAAIAIYAFLLYRENRKTYQCTLSYKTIGQAIGASNNTVRKYVLELEAAGLIATNRTVVLDANGKERNGSLRYTILPVQNAVELYHQRQLWMLPRNNRR